MQAAAQIGDAEGRDAAAERRHDRAEQHAEDADIGTQQVSALRRGWRSAIGCSAAPAAVTGEVQLTDAVGRRARSPVGLSQRLGAARRLLPPAGVDRGLDRHAGPDQRAERRDRVQRDLHRNTLHDLGEIARRVVGRQQREGAAGAGRPAVDMAGQHEVRETRRR